MRLWLLRRDVDGPEYDSYHGHVVRAETAEDARIVAAKMAADEGYYVWLSADVTCEEITADGPTSVVLSDFNAG